MKFRNDDFPTKQGSNSGSELTDAIAEEHPKHLLTLAEQRIMAMHSHDNGSAVELHEIGSKEFIQQSMSSSLEGRIGIGSADNSELPLLPQNAGKIEYEKKSSQNQPRQLYGLQQSVTGGVSHTQETFMMGCNCGAEWTVTGQSTKADPSNPASVKIEQYGSGAGQAPGYKVSGGGPGEYRAGGGQQQDYKG